MKTVNKYIDLTNLPNKNNRIQWDKSVGMKVPFIYNKFNGELEILDYSKGILSVNFNEKIFTITVDSFKKVALGRILGVISMDFKFKINTNLINDKRDMTVIDREYRFAKRGDKRKYYKLKCNLCGYDNHWACEGTIMMGCGCPVCCSAPKVVVEGINDITTTDPWMIKYFQGGHDEARLYTYNSGKKINPICPDCGKIGKLKPIYRIHKTKSIACTCGDGVSFPNKFVFSFLSQLNVSFDYEKSFDWSDRKIYDDYIESQSIIIENHGGSHYYSHFSEIKNGRSFEEELDNDEYKEKMANENGIKHYIKLDCRISDKEWIRKSIMNSELSKLLNFSDDDINWDECEEFALGNWVKKICNYKKQNPLLYSSDIAKIVNLLPATVSRYLRLGSKYGFCDYNGKEENKRANREPSKDSNHKPLICMETNEVFRSSRYFVDDYLIKHGVKLQGRNIRSVCNGKRNHVNNLHFQYITREEFNTIKSQSPELAFGDYFILPEEIAQ